MAAAGTMDGSPVAPLSYWGQGRLDDAPAEVAERPGVHLDSPQSAEQKEPLSCCFCWVQVRNPELLTLSTVILLMFCGSGSSCWCELSSFQISPVSFCVIPSCCQTSRVSVGPLIFTSLTRIQAVLHASIEQKGQKHCLYEPFGQIRRQMKLFEITC